MTTLLLHIKQFITPSEHQLQNLKSLLLVDTIDKHFAMCCIFKFHLKVVSLPYFFFLMKNALRQWRRFTLSSHELGTLPIFSTNNTNLWKDF